MRLGVFDIDVGVKFELKMVGGLFGFRGTFEGEASRLYVELELLFGNIGCGDGQVDEVLLRIRGG